MSETVWGKEESANQILTGSRMISCVVPDDGTDRKLIRALRDNKEVISANSKSCRGIAMLRPSETKPGKLPESELVRLIEVIVPESYSEELFNYIFDIAEINRSGGGIIWMGKQIMATEYVLASDVPDETQND